MLLPERLLHYQTDRLIPNKISPSISTVSFIRILQTLRFWQYVLRASYSPDEYIRLTGRNVSLQNTQQMEEHPVMIMIHEVTGQFEIKSEEVQQRRV